MDAVQAKQIDDSLPVQIKVGLSEQGYVVIQSNGERRRRSELPGAEQGHCERDRRAES